MTPSDPPPTRSVLQEYLSLLNDAASAHDAQDRDVKLLRAWGVFRYIIAGPMNCERCQAQVRLAIPITSERFSGEILQFACLCANCTFKELKVARCVTMQVGSARVEYPHEGSLS